MNTGKLMTMIKGILTKIDMGLPVAEAGAVLRASSGSPYSWSEQITCESGEMIGRALNAAPGGVSCSNVKPITTITQTDAPDTDQVPNGHVCLWIDSDDGKTYLVYNKNGTIRKVELT